MSRILARVPVAILFFAFMVTLVVCGGGHPLGEAIMIVSQALLSLVSLGLILASLATVFEGDRFSTKSMWVINVSMLFVVTLTASIIIFEQNILSFFS